MQLRDHVVVGSWREPRALRERVEVLVHRKALDLTASSASSVAGAFGKGVMIPGGGGLRRQIERKRPVAAADCRRREVDVPVESEIEH